jgi:hypothetical protein
MANGRDVPMQTKFYLNTPLSQHPANRGILVNVSPVRDQESKPLKVVAESGREYWLLKEAEVRSYGKNIRVDASLRDSGLVPGRIWKQKSLDGPFGTRGETFYFILVASAELATQEAVNGLDDYIQTRAKEIQQARASLDSTLEEMGMGDDALSVVAQIHEGMNDDPEDGYY